VIVPELCPDDGLQAQLPEHVTAVCAYLPATQLSQAVLTPDKALYLLASQLVQSAAPATALYFPASHISHVKVPV
jgi:hypothetical protein